MKPLKIINKIKSFKLFKFATRSVKITSETGRRMTSISVSGSYFRSHILEVGADYKKEVSRISCIHATIIILFTRATQCHIMINRLEQ